MDNKLPGPGRKQTPKNRRAKNAGFAALILLFLLIVLAAYDGQSTNLQEISDTQALASTNAGDYSKVLVSGNELEITPKGQNHATLKAYVDPNTSLKQQGYNISKAQVTYKSTSSNSSELLNLASSIIPVVLIGALLYFMLRSAQGQGNQALSFGKSKARLYGNEKDKVTFKEIAGSDEAKQDLEVCRYGRQNS
jgi:cell division protease FtsH